MVGTGYFAFTYYCNIIDNLLHLFTSSFEWVATGAQFTEPFFEGEVECFPKYSALHAFCEFAIRQLMFEDAEEQITDIQRRYDELEIDNKAKRLSAAFKRSVGVQKAVFEKNGENTYNVTFQSLEDAPQKTWLLSWNPSGWNWTDYHEAAVRTHAGDSYEDYWTCASTKVQPGDRVFLIMLGTGEKNGIIASGYATSGSFEDEHWDPEKAAQGKKAKRINVRFDWISDYETDPYLKQSDLKELFPDQEWSPMGSGISIQDQYVSQLEEEWAKVIGSGGEEELSIKETIEQIKAYIAANGFTYENGLIENFYLSLQSKPFVILAGTSGTGKTRLVKLFAEAIGATGANGRYQMVSVRPDWSDSTDLFGHVDLNGRFIPGAIIDFVKRAEIDSGNPYILCLDEMNLARVEYYLSDILSVIETRDFDARKR